MRLSAMSFVRRASMLALIVAMVLPQAFSFDCCCSRRIAAEQAKIASMKPCCRARLEMASRNQSAKDDSRTAIKLPPCRCRATVVAPAVIDAKLRVVSGNWVQAIPQPSVDLVALQELPSRCEDLAAQNRSLVGPPARKLLCRWVI